MKIKITMVVMALAALLSFGGPYLVLRNNIGSPPAIAFIQKKKKKPIRLTDKYLFDDGMIIPVE